MKRTLSFLFVAMIFTLVATIASAQSYKPGVNVIVIDAGHGGDFPGATYGGVKEKDINLKIALKLGALLEKELPNVKIVYTRKTDKALGKTLKEDLTARANIANKAGGDFFISIHANASKKSSVYGTETLIMGESVKETQYSEDAIIANNKEEIIDMSDENTAAMVRAYIQNLQYTYGQYSEAMARMVQKHYTSGGRKSRGVKSELLKVLYATDMPSILTEVGFMSNPQELAYMKSEKGQAAYARMLCDAVKEYVKLINGISQLSADVDTSADEKSEPQVEKKVEQKPQTPAKSQTTPAKTDSSKSSGAKSNESLTSGFTIQLSASDKQLKSNDPWFKTYRGKVVCYKGTGKYPYKYCYGKFSTREQAQKALVEVKKTFRDAYIVSFQGSKLK